MFDMLRGFWSCRFDKISANVLNLDYTRRARVALRAFVWKTFDLRQSGVDHDFSIFKKLNIFVFTLCIWTHLWKILIFGSYILRKTFFIFSSKKLDVVTITRYQITFWIFDFSLFDILPKYIAIIFFNGCEIMDIFLFFCHGISGA